MQTRGTPHERDALTVCQPAWVTITDASGSTDRCGMYDPTRVLAGIVRPAGSTAGPVVNSTRAGSGATASSTRPARPTWSMKLVLRLTTISGSSSPEGHGDVHVSALGSKAGPTYR